MKISLGQCANYDCLSFFVFAFFDGAYRPAHLRINLITDLETEGRKKEVDNRRNQAIRILNEEYLRHHPYMYYEHPVEQLGHITFRIKKNPAKPHAGLTFLQDVFGDKIICRNIGEKYEIKFHHNKVQTAYHFLVLVTGLIKRCGMRIASIVCSLLKNMDDNAMQEYANSLLI